MNKAIQLANKAGLLGEVPIGAIIVKDNQIIGEGYNQKEFKQNPLLHAEIIAIEAAAKKLGSWRLTDCQMFVSLEPCPMCAGALVQARVKRLVYGTPDPKSGGMVSKFSIGNDDQLNHTLLVEQGPLQAKCSELLTNFFKNLRQKK